MLCSRSAQVVSSALLSRTAVLSCSVRHAHPGQGYSDNYQVHRQKSHPMQKHRNIAFRGERRDKVLKIELIDFYESVDDLTPQEIRMKMKKKGVFPARPWIEKPVHIASTISTFEAYIPPEGDGKLSLATKDGAKQKMELFGKKGKNYLSMRKIYRYDEDFDIKEFAHHAQDLYIKAHNALAEEDDELLHDLVTERAFPIVTHETKRKTIRWQFLETIEPPRAVQVRCTDMVSPDNLFAQITVRLHTKQTLAVYDRFGRLMHGSEVVAKDVLEYVVFEKHIVNTYGSWRIHDKIIPSWAAPRPPAVRTFRLPAEEVEEENRSTPSTAGSVPPPQPSSGDGPTLATA